MNVMKHFCLAMTIIIVLTAGLRAEVSAQSSIEDELNRKILELMNAGKFDEALPLAQQVVAITENVRGTTLVLRRCR